MKGITLILALVVSAACNAPEQSADERNERLDNAAAVAPVTPAQSAAMQAIHVIDAMRSDLAGGISEIAEVNGKTFVQVCKPVGMRLKETAQENGWVIRQLAVKYRNPAHAPDPEAAGLFPRFESESSLDSLWLRSEHDGAPGMRYLRRITVEPACLSCHGAREARPEFVKEKYLEDRAFGFEAGDLRGLYSVFVPDSSEASRD